MKDTAINIDPIALADRLCKLSYDLTEENRHTDAFLVELASDVIAAQAMKFRDSVKSNSNSVS